MYQQRLTDLTSTSSLACLNKILKPHHELESFTDIQSLDLLISVSHLVKLIVVG